MARNEGMMQRVVERVDRGAETGVLRNLVEVLHRSVVARGEETALASKGEGGWGEISYAELWRRVERFAAGLASLGVGGGAKVAVVSKNRPEWPIADFAIQSLGAATVPIYPTLGAAQISHILADCGAVVAIAEDEEILGKVLEVRDVLPGLRRVVLIKGDPGDEALPMGDVERGGEESPLTGWEEGWRGIGRDDIATIIYTSGTMGLPKGVVLTHGNLLSNVEAGLRALPLGPDDIFLSFLPLSHVFERTGGQYSALYLGAATYYAEAIEKVPDNLREVRPTVVLSVPRLYEKMHDRVSARVAGGSAIRRRLFEAAIAAGREKYAAEREGRVGAALRARSGVYDRLVFRKIREGVGGRLRFFISGGAKLEAQIGEFFYAAGITIVEGYGLTETSPVISCNRLGAVRFGTVGLPLDNVEVRISPEGEVQVRGPSVMRGYWNKPDATREAFTADGWYRTGDMGEIDEEGYLKITDRIKNLIVLSTGKNVAPQPIEAALVSAPHVSQAVVLGDGRKYVSSLVVPNYDAVRNTLGVEDTNEALADEERCRRLVEGDVDEACARFADYERPKKVALLPRELSHEAGELTPTLKVKLRVVKERYAKNIEEMYS